jgi:hypothetical protein
MSCAAATLPDSKQMLLTSPPFFHLANSQNSFLVLHFLVHILPPSFPLSLLCRGLLPLKVKIRTVIILITSVFASESQYEVIQDLVSLVRST